jgi:MoaA/NifB/PqqE/SkfB family radical SAM enzyme
MKDLAKILNRRIVRRFFNYYATKGKQRVYEFFGDSKEKSLSAFLGRIPIQVAVNLAMKKLGLTEEMKNGFFSERYNRQTIMNLIRTVADHGLNQPFRFDAPVVVVWNYTNLCNLRCRYCYQSAGKHLEDELSFQEKIDLINQMVDANVGFLAFSGGEPIIGDRFWDVLCYASKFLHTSIATNATLLADRSLVERLSNNGAHNVFVSLDGATAESHDFIRGEGSFRKTIKGIENLVANNYLHVGINTVVTKRNFHEVRDIIELAIKLGVNSFSHYNFIPTGRGKNNFDDDITPEQREELLNLLFDYHLRMKETGLSIISTAPQYARIIYERTEGEGAGLFHYTADNMTTLKSIIKYAGGCGAGRVYGAVQPNGIMTPCVFMPEVPIGDLRKERFIDIWRNAEVCDRMVDREHFHHTCERFRYICGGCRARAYAYGDIIGPDPGCIIYKKSKGEIMESRELEREPALV